MKIALHSVLAIVLAVSTLGQHAQAYENLGNASMEGLTRVPPVASPLYTPGSVAPASYSEASPFASPSAYSTAASSELQGDFMRYDLVSDCGADSCCDTACCPRTYCGHRCGVFADILYLTARNVDMPYAIPHDGIDPDIAVPVGPVGTANPGYEIGYRVGYNHAISSCSSLMATFTWYESDANSSIATNAPNVIHSLVTHPNTLSAATNSQLATARYDIDFQLADIDYRQLYSGGPYHEVNWLVGVRYGHLEQDFRSEQTINVGTTSVDTGVDFDGVGVRFGLEGERSSRCNGLMVYGRGLVNFLSGRFNAEYVQFDTFALTQAATSFKDDRVVPVLEYELGVGWTSASGNVRVRAGYYMAAWYNALTTGTWVQAVQAEQFVDVNDTITFDGLVGRIEYFW